MPEPDAAGRAPLARCVHRRRLQVYRIFRWRSLPVATQYFIIGVLLALVVASSVLWPIMKGVSCVATHLQRRRARPPSPAGACACSAVLFLFVRRRQDDGAGRHLRRRTRPCSPAPTASCDGVAARPSHGAGGAPPATEDLLLVLRIRVLEAQQWLLASRAQPSYAATACAGS